MVILRVIKEVYIYTTLVKILSQEIVGASDATSFTCSLRAYPIIFK